MKLNLKVITIGIIALVFLIALLLVLTLTEKLLNIWQSLQMAPWWMVLAYTLAITTVSVLAIYLYVRLIHKAPEKKINTPVLDEASLKTAVDEHREKGVDTYAAEIELNVLEERRDDGFFYICLFGEASAGKSSFIKALMPSENVLTKVTTGTTQDIKLYEHHQLIVADVPGFNSLDADHEHIEQYAFEEAQRAHIIIYLVDSDLSRQDGQQIERISQLNRPFIIAFNKIDRYSSTEQSRIIQSIEKKTHNAHPVIPIATGGQETIIIKNADGSESRHVRERTAEIMPLIRSIKKLIEQNPETLNKFRDAGLLLLAQEKLDKANKVFNVQQTEQIILSYTKKAIAGALASVAPGSDLVIQGAIASKMVRDICNVYHVKPKQIQIDQVLKMTGGRLRTSTSVVLAVAGNALKAFPGVGTAVGGLMHAVAYGMIFNALGKAVHESVASQGRLDLAMTKTTFEDNLLGHSTQLAKDLAQMALKIKKQHNSTTE